MLVEKTVIVELGKFQPRLLLVGHLNALTLRKWTFQRFSTAFWARISEDSAINVEIIVSYADQDQ